MKITERAIAAVQRHGESTYPEECCGFLIGSVTPHGNEVQYAAPVLNRAGVMRERRYHITAADYQEADQEARLMDCDIVGFYHSHPDHPARPSETDLAEATLPGYTYMIVSVVGGTACNVTAWLLGTNRSRFNQESIEVVGSGRPANRLVS